MSEPFFQRPHKLSNLVYFVPALAVFASAGLLHHPFTLVLLLAADALTLAAVCQAMGAGRESTFVHSVVHSGCAYFILLLAYTMFTALVLGYPLYLLLRGHSLEAALLLSTAAFVALLAPWSSWPAPGFAFVRDDAWSEDGRSLGIFAALARCLGLARSLTASNDLFFASGLIASLALLAIAQGALVLAAMGTLLADEFRLPALAIYALVVAPLAHWLIVHCSARALQVERQRAGSEADKVAPPDESVASATVPPAPKILRGQTQADLNAMLLHCVRSCQTELALTALARGADPNHVPDAGERDQRSVVVLACVSPDLRLLRGLIAKGADVNRVHAGLPPLIAATRDSHQGRPDAVMTLLTNGADPRCIDGEGNTPLHYAARAAQPIVAALLCDAGAQIDALNHEGQTPLGIASAAGSRDLVRFLLDRHANPALERAPPALIAAAASADDDPQLVKLLLKHKAQVDACDALGRSALMTAALHGNADIAAALLKAGAQVDRADAHGTTALMEAARSGAADVLDALAAHAPVADAGDHLGRTALMLACQSTQADESIVRRLLALGASRQSATPDGRRAVDFAAAAGRWNIVGMLDPDYLLPANIDAASAPPLLAQEDSPAHLLDALRFAHWHIVDNFASTLREWPAPQRAQLFRDLADQRNAAARAWLLNHGLDAQAQLADGTALLNVLLMQLPANLPAARELVAAGAQATGVGILDKVLAALTADAAPRDTLETLALEMIERGADIFAANANAETPLARAVGLGSVPVAQALLERGVDVNTRDRQGRTPLFAALGLPSEQALALTRTLIRAGADPEVAAANSETPLGLALSRAQSDLRHWLNWTLWKLPKRALRDADLPAAASLGDIAAVDKLLELDLPIDALDAQGASALLRAAGAGHADLVVHLLERGAQVGRAAPSGATALSAAVSARRDAVVAALLERNIAVDQRLPGGGTPLMIAAALGYPEIVARLLARGADANAQDERGTRALHAAAQFAFGNRDTARARRVLELLIEKGADLNSTDAKGRTALLLLLGARAEPGSATDQQHVQTLLALFLIGRADVNQQDERGVSPLHACAMHGLLLPARALLAARADPQCRDVLERTPREVATLLGYVDLAAELAVRVPAAMPMSGQPAALR